MDKNILTNLYELYTRDGPYVEQITQDIEYQTASKEIHNQHMILTKILNKNQIHEDEIIKIIDNIDGAYMDLFSVYQYHDFMNGIAFGVALSSILSQSNNKDLAEKIKKCFDDFTY